MGLTNPQGPRNRHAPNGLGFREEGEVLGHPPPPPLTPHRAGSGVPGSQEPLADLTDVCDNTHAHRGHAYIKGHQGPRGRHLASVLGLAPRATDPIAPALLAGRLPVRARVSRR